MVARNSGKDILSSETMKREVDFLNQPHPNAELEVGGHHEIDSLLYEIARLFDYYRNRAKSTVHTVFLSGGGALMPGLVGMWDGIWACRSTYRPCCCPLRAAPVRSTTGGSRCCSMPMPRH